MNRSSSINPRHSSLRRRATERERTHDVAQFIRAKGFAQAPIAGYAFYYLNRPEFLREDLTLRMAIAPVYFDSELGFSHALGPNTDLGLGVAGGGFAESYNEVRGGRFIPKES